MLTERPSRSRSHEWIDQRSLAMERAVAQKLRAEPDLLLRAKNILERWIQQQQPDVPLVLLEWRDILDNWPLEQILEVMTSFEEESRRLRQSSPFCGILSQEERKAIFQEYELEHHHQAG